MTTLGAAAALAATVVPTLSLAAPAAHAASNVVKVKPRIGSRTTHFVVSFRAPDAAGPYGATDRRYSVEATGPVRSGCDSSGARAVDFAGQGQLVHVKFVPSGHWCRGTYHGAVDELMSPLCMPVHACPMFVTTIRTVGRFKFKVR